MKIHSLQKQSLIDYPEVLSCVVFVGGCNFCCPYCYNQNLITDTADNITHGQFFSFLKERKGFLDAVVICGGEPTLQDGLIDFMRKIKRLGFKVKLDTNGSRPDVLENILKTDLLKHPVLRNDRDSICLNHNKQHKTQPIIDYIAMDVKAPLNKYNLICGTQTDTSKILQSIAIIKNSDVPCEFRTTFTPQLNEDDIEQIAALLKGADRYYIQPYIPVNSFLSPKLKPHSRETFNNALNRAKKHTKAFLRD